MRKTILVGILPFLPFAFNFSQAQQKSFLQPADSFQAGRTIAVGAALTGIYTGTLIGLNQLWYADFPKTEFHFFNDNGEWLQIDKVGHFQTACFESSWSTSAFQWAGVNDKVAYWLGSATGFLLQSSIEVLDGYSEKWGASAGDLAANALGSAFCLSQNLVWNEQRLLLKFSSHAVDYTAYEGYDAIMQNRVDDLFGSGFFETVIKDYNGQTYWLSANIKSFLNEESKFPPWFNVAIGYGAEGMLGGFENEWGVNSEILSAYQVPRLRQFYLSPDLDLSKIKTESRLLRLILGMANVIKVPAPAVEIASDGKFQLHPFYF
jgi:hypothetical protein